MKNNGINKINKSENDSREYYWIKLENELKVIIIEDHGTTQCSALLNVNIGSIQEEAEGLAHFLEHMVFMGSGKYPDESNFMDFVKKNGGMTNAMTSDTNTTYYFTVSDNKFLDILDMFSWFFIDPLLKIDGIEREINAVDSESKKNLLDDGWIFNEILRTTMSIGHPINHYTCGDKASLNGNNLRDKVKNFFDDHYSSNLMNLVIFKNKSVHIDKIIKQINETFGKIKNKGIILNKKYGDILEPLNIVKYIPNRTHESLTICMQVSTFNDYINNPMHFLKYIIQSKTENSIFKTYERENIILNFDFNELYKYDDYSIYSFEIMLKEKIDNSVYTDHEITNIVKVFFDYIKSISKCSYLKEIYDKLIMSNRRIFNIPTNSDNILTMFYFNNRLLDGINPANLLDYVLQKNPYEKIEKDFIFLLDNISQMNSSVIYSSKKFNFPNPQKLNRFETKYIINRFQPHELKTKKYNIIKPNLYISDKFKLIDSEDNYPNKSPEKVEKNGYTFIYNFNSSFKTPHVYTYILLEVSNFIKDINTYVKCILFLDTIYSNNDNVLSELRMAGYNIGFSLNMDSMFIVIDSDNNNIETVYNIFNEIFNDNSNKNYDAVVQSLYRKSKSFKNENPLYKVKELTNKLFYNYYYTPYEICKSIKRKHTFNDCKTVFRECMRKACTQIFISGNIERNRSEKLSELLYSYLNITNPTNKTHGNLQRLECPFTQKYKNKNNDETNNIFTMIFKIGNLEKGKGDWNLYIAFASILESLAGSLYFNILRTREQIGYVVSASLTKIGDNNYKFYGIKFIVQSYIKDSKYIYTRTLNFVNNELKKCVDNITENDFNDYKAGEISMLLDNFSNLAEMNQYLSIQIFDGSYMYDYRKNMIDTFNNFNLDTFKKMFYKHIITEPELYSISIDSNRTE